MESEVHSESRKHPYWIVNRDGGYSLWIDAMQQNATAQVAIMGQIYDSSAKRTLSPADQEEAQAVVSSQLRQKSSPSIRDKLTCRVNRAGDDCAGTRYINTPCHGEQNRFHVRSGGLDCPVMERFRIFWRLSAQKTPLIPEIELDAGFPEIGVGQLESVRVQCLDGWVSHAACPVQPCPHNARRGSTMMPPHDGMLSRVQCLFRSFYRHVSYACMCAQSAFVQNSWSGIPASWRLPCLCVLRPVASSYTPFPPSTAPRRTEHVTVQDTRPRRVERGSGAFPIDVSFMGGAQPERGCHAMREANRTLPKSIDYFVSVIQMRLPAQNAARVP
ncbi:uncharacterized protein MYCFIDRAFT_169757 [Pseudocercospora fijiensis CIRAD86]|uniref:Uncharacterized protein n=1 Tax=Pseudocercospora fijiensis (strain CIRAD86) TaxID=383855 RepID=N1Q6K5_PSEFD|nr:uncharacterized protein MYCFIDRAFT_169757 [Pseudocercospora fijiensis CIRAD86]EME88055.1 hypothetical protein MYCFIDRAFT_169757 [Pseudocercospora fijiensis CIRAD86]